MWYDKILAEPLLWRYSLLLCVNKAYSHAEILLSHLLVMVLSALYYTLNYCCTLAVYIHPGYTDLLPIGTYYLLLLTSILHFLPYYLYHFLFHLHV